MRSSETSPTDCDAIGRCLCRLACLGFVLAITTLSLITTATRLSAAENGENAPSSVPTVRRDLPPPAGQPLAGQALDEQTYELATKLRCPVCQGLSVAASPSPSALAMREEIRDLLGTGYNEDQVVAYFEGAYGEFVRLVPKAEGFNLLVWVVPVVALLAGLVLVWRFAGNETSSAPADPAEDEELSEFLSEVRTATATHERTGE